MFYRGYFPRIAEKYAFDKTSAGATFLALYKNTAAVYYLITAYPIGLFERPAHIFIPPAGDPSCHLTWRAASARRFLYDALKSGTQKLRKYPPHDPKTVRGMRFIQARMRRYRADSTRPFRQ